MNLGGPDAGVRIVGSYRLGGMSLETRPERAERDGATFLADIDRKPNVVIRETLQRLSDNELLYQLDVPPRSAKIGCRKH